MGTFLERFGGDEFIVILIDSDKSTALPRLEAFRNEVKRSRIMFDDITLPSITISVGLAEALTDGSTVDEIINAADQALYLAKQNGRDRVEIYNSDV